MDVEAGLMGERFRMSRSNKGVGIILVVEQLVGVREVEEGDDIEFVKLMLSSTAVGEVVLIAEGVGL